jgi:hypothetical protein
MKAPNITVNDALDKLVNRLTTSGPYIARVMTQSAEDIAKNARAYWPYGVRKYKSSRPHSRDLIKTDAGTTGDHIVSFVVIEVDYAFYIKSWKNDLRGQSPWQELLRKPGIAEGKRLGAVLAEDLAEIAGGRRG